MNRHTNWMDKPVTWGAYLKLSGICALVGMAISVASSIMLMEPIWWKATKDFVRRLFNK